MSDMEDNTNSHIDEMEDLESRNREKDVIEETGTEETPNDEATEPLEHKVFDDSISTDEEVEEERDHADDDDGDGDGVKESTKATLKARKRTKKRTTAATFDKKRTEISERVLEARKDFDDALEKIKSQGNRRHRSKYEPTDPIDLDEQASSFRRKMETAAERDNKSVIAGQAALEKHKMLPEVIEMMNKKHLHEIILDCGILSAVRVWMEPLPNKSLPAIHLRKALLELLRTLPIETDHLRESQLGRIVTFFARRPKESPEIQRLSKELISRWSRPIIGDRLLVDNTDNGNDDPNYANRDDNNNVSSRRHDQQPVTLQSMAFKELSGRTSDVGLSIHQKKLTMHMQKKLKSKKNLLQ